MSGPDGHGIGPESSLRQAAGPGKAGEQQVFIERCLKRARVGDSQNSPRLPDVVGDTGAGLEAVVRGGAGVVLSAKSKLEEEVARFDRVLPIEGVLVDVG